MSIFQNVYCMCVNLYIHNKYTQNTYQLCKQNFILDAINHLTALVLLYYICL